MTAVFAPITDFMAFLVIVEIVSFAVICLFALGVGKVLAIWKIAK